MFHLGQVMGQNPCSIGLQANNAGSLDEESQKQSLEGLTIEVHWEMEMLVPVSDMYSQLQFK